MHKMPIKNLLHRFQPIQLYIVLVLSILYFSAQLLLSQITHALTVLMSAYHMLCNIFAILGCIATIKHSQSRAIESELTADKSLVVPVVPIDANGVKVLVAVSVEKNELAKRESQEFKLRNTFGWTRIDILTMLIVCIVLASLSFSLLIESLQTLINIEHKDAMQCPIPMLLLGFAGLVLNGLSYLLIGGYTLHQVNFLRVTPNGDVILNRIDAELKLKTDEQQLSHIKNDQQLHDELKAEIGKVHYLSKRQGAIELLRDSSSTIIVIICALVVYMTENDEVTVQYAEYIDPVLAIVSCVLLIMLSYPYMKESCLILLQTIPDSIDKEIIERTLITKFPQILSFHDLHIWQLSAHKNVATVHMKFDSARLYTKVIDDVRAYFHEQGISQLTIQPEFHCARAIPSLDCLVRCRLPECMEKFCCKDATSGDLREVSICPNGGINTKKQMKECFATAIEIIPKVLTTEVLDTLNISEVTSDLEGKSSATDSNGAEQQSMENNQNVSDIDKKEQFDAEASK